MTHAVKTFIHYMLNGHYMMHGVGKTGLLTYRVYDRDKNVCFQIARKTVDRLPVRFKKDNKQRYTLNLQSVRKLRKNHFIKVEYTKKFKNEKIRHSGGHVEKSAQ